MTETRLRTWTHSFGYGLAALFIFSLALQNLRYGFYELFYLALAMTCLLLAGLIYTFVCRRQQLSAPGHLLILAGLNAGLVAAILVLDSPGVTHWAMPLLILNLLVLPLRQGLSLSALLLVPVIGAVWFGNSAAYALMTSMGLILTLAVGALYIWHYDHIAQSAEDLAITDPVTGAHNSRFLDETLQKEISRAIATGHPLSVINLSFDYTDEIRDLHGKAGLQNLFKSVTEHLFGVIRAGDSLYTLNDSEFFLILPFTPEEGVRVIAERIRRSIGEREWSGIGRLSVSLGCTTRGNGDTSTVSLRNRANQAMHQARQRGMDSAWFSPGESVDI
ncbi:MULTISPECIES: GGDEF domain-containing protein [Marinobacter]|uniref:diguanylate cyclase n=1 Tax=Marinobacter excellens LAMA 842 TaxID=1306954 RepID=A0A137S688_9GAMM|nr:MULTISPECIES: GGDEF domain-containing protein [Marinobacter]AMQ90036.1 diguanylate cyclase [Marinobacter sp. LQ44]KXO07949.1 diguanylate cyclase (GGDEF domain with PAS/PAC sensor) [Marinobacter excellens LAMA 842]